MRTLVVGIYPPPASAQARGTMALVRDLAENGHDVDVLAQQHAASLLRSRVDGPVGAWNLWRHRRGYDETFVMVDAVLRYPAGRLYRLTRVIDCAAWGLVLRLLRRVALVVRDPGLIPGSVGGRTGRMLWKNASRILVATDYSAQMLVDKMEASLRDLLCAPSS